MSNENTSLSLIQKFISCVIPWLILMFIAKNIFIFILLKYFLKKNYQKVNIGCKQPLNVHNDHRILDLEVIFRVHRKFCSTVSFYCLE